jgi:hypothetical protein
MTSNQYLYESLLNQHRIIGNQISDIEAQNFDLNQQQLHEIKNLRNKQSKIFRQIQNLLLGSQLDTYQETDKEINLPPQNFTIPDKSPVKSKKQKLLEDFDWEFYLYSNKDLKNNGINNETKAIKHFLAHGIKENRIYSIPNVVNNCNQNQFIKICVNLTKYLPNTFPKINKKSTKKTLLIETRNLDHLEFVIKNTIQKVGEGWGHIIYCTENNYKKIIEITNQISNDIEIRILNNDFDRNSYNNLLLSLDFWNSLNCEKLLIYQSDTFICKKLDEVFLDYDYIGGYWGTTHSFFIEKTYQEKDIFIGNGGLNLRSVKKTIEILESKKPLINKQKNENLEFVQEDLFFSIEFKKNNSKLPSIQTSIDFSSEIEFNPTSFGLHQPWKFFDNYQELKINLEKLFFLKNKKRIIFINHEESLTGAPRLLKDIINYEFSTREFDIFYLSLSINDDEWDLPNKILYQNLEGTCIEKVKYISSVFNPDMVFGNTFLSIKVTSLFNCKKVIFIHEYRSFIPSLINGNYKLLENFDKVFVACENTLKLLDERNIKSEVIPYYLNTNLINEIKFEKTNREYIVGIGYAQLRKGLDRFIEIASQLPDENFLWVGSTNGIEISNQTVKFRGQNFLLPKFEIGQNFETIKKEIIIPENLKFAGLVQNEQIVKEILPKTKCLLMLSTDDPFPLVVIESKILNTNVVNLKESGDSYKLSDSNDLVLDCYNPQKVINYLQKLKPNKFKINKSIQKTFNNNIQTLRKKYTDILDDKIKVFFSIDSDSYDFAFEMLKKSVLSVKKFPNYEIIVITNKINQRLLEYLEEKEIIEYNSDYESLIKNYYKTYRGVAGAYYRLDIPKLCKNLNFEDEYVLYCDYDVLWVKDIKNFIPKYEVKYFAAAQEFKKTSKNEFNTGIIWMNVKNLLEKSEILYTYVKDNLKKLKTHDQDALNKVFENEIDFLDNRLNWKPYWGVVNDISIIHYHWIKPNTDLSDNILLEKFESIGVELIDKKSIPYFQQKWITT